MADPTMRNLPLDPMALWRDAVSQWEKGINEVAGQTMASPEFAQGMHGAMGSTLSAQKAVADLMGRYLTAVNLPSRAEVAALGERLTEIEARLIRMTTLLEHLVDPSVAQRSTGAVPKVPRTKRPPSQAALPSPAPEPARKAARRRAGSRP